MAVCHDCIQAKCHKLPFSPSVSISIFPLQLVHSDVWGPCSVVSDNEFRYYVTFIDDFSKFTWIYFMKQKSDVIKIFTNFKAQVENVLGTTIKVLRTDGGTEYKPVSTFYPAILHQTSCPHTPQQNGTAERKHRHIIELALATMAHASIPTQYWADIFASVVYIINRLPANHKIPYKTLFNKDPDYQFLRILGCLCFPLTKPYNTSKMELRSLPCVFLGYALSQKGYRCLHLPSNKIYISRHVQFDESVFPFKLHLNSLQSTETSSQPANLQLPLLLPSSTLNTPIHAQSDPHSPIQLTSPHSSPVNTPVQPEPILPPSNSPVNPPPSHSMVTRTQDHSRRPRVFTDYVAHLASMDSEPTSYSQAKNFPHWRAAMASELDALAKNNTWSLVPLPAGQTAIGCKWVYKLKRKSDGTIDRHKARLVAKGYNQIEGVDFFDTYSPVVRPSTIRAVLSLAVSSNWFLRQLDVQNAFLHGDLTETVYMTQPPGFTDSSFPDHVCLLKKSLYGLKQAPRAWFQKLSTTLQHLGFQPSAYDPSLFLLHSSLHTIMILIYVDDILITGTDAQAVQHCISQLHSHFAIKDLGSLHYFLGVEAHFSDQGLTLTQTKYLMDLLTRVNMIEAKPCLTPMAVGTSLSKDDGPLFGDPQLFRSIVGALQYATLTRPDISFAVNKLSQFMHQPTTSHWTAAKRLLRYLCGTLHHGLLISKTSSTQIHAFSDADWAGDSDDRRSTSGFCIFLGSNLISWCAKKQPTVSRSSTEAEYRSLAITCTELMWLQFLLTELKVSFSSPPILWCDNIGATFLAANPQFHARTKHIEIDYHFVHEKVQAQQLKVRFVCSADQIADCMTKPLPLPRFNLLRDKLTVIPITLA